MFYFFGSEACGILAPQPETELTPHVLEGEILTAWPLEKSPIFYFPYSTWFLIWGYLCFELAFLYFYPTPSHFFLALRNPC